MYLGIEIGGTKLQAGVGNGFGPPLTELGRQKVAPGSNAKQICHQIAELAQPLIARHAIRGMGIGFGGPVDASAGRVITSHQVAGWDDFPLGDWCRQTLGLPAVLANDSDSAGVAEARFGGGKGANIVFYSNVGSGIGGAFVVGGKLYGGSVGVCAELGHLRPGPQAELASQTVESLASGWAIAAHARTALAAAAAGDPTAADLLARCQGQADQLTTDLLAQAALAGNALAQAAFQRAAKVYGWGLAQMITLLAPHVVVIGGGVSLAGESVFLAPVRAAVEQYVFPPLRGTYRIVPAVLGEEVVVHGVLAIAQQTFAA